MKLLLVGYRFDAVGGLEIVSAGLGKALSQLGHEVQCAAVGISESWQADGHRGVGLAPPGRWLRRVHHRWPTVTAGKMMRELLAWCDVALVCHCHLLPFVRRCRPRQAGRPAIIAWLHGREVWGDYALQYRDELAQADLLVAVSRYTSDTVVGLLGEHHRPVVIPNPVDIEIFRPAAQEQDVVRCSMFTAGRHTPDTQHKGYDRVIEALGLIRDESPSLPLTLTIGGGGPRLPALHEAARKLGLGDRVRFVGPLSRSELIRQYAVADLFVFPSRVVTVGGDVWGEGFGVVNIEAAACGRPVLTSTHGGCPETIVDGQTGILVDPSTPASIAAGITKIFQLPPTARDAMGRLGRAFVAEQFSFPAYRRRLEQLLARVRSNTTA